MRDRMKCFMISEASQGPLLWHAVASFQAVCPGASALTTHQPSSLVLIVLMRKPPKSGLRSFLVNSGCLIRAESSTTRSARATLVLRTKR
ncbi:uncharacterized protein LY89DRAFT_47017 [Mollisia scopiformis]|uniref:Uncharacterized protein n=1 Tax=Mollisia scopiformis TaxID=149040 RepID=A0A194XDZ7_MOLSC|nr:uncharacterized protein LY89DRAFT_47017 [Mollisia scopiformis]KUJ18374.1 hypothetical protein LY89DRAFT_47017 [Mollisia scopiformis]